MVPRALPPNTNDRRGRPRSLRPALGRSHRPFECWRFHDFRGDRWCNISNTDNRAYLRNAYRVLLTRARQGMVIFVPPGNGADPTLSAAFYDSTFGYLSGLGIPTLS